MKVCLCNTDSLELQGFIKGNEYDYEYSECFINFRVWNEYGDGFWFNESLMNELFIKY